MGPMRIIDVRSDTVTQPTQEMREAMYRAEVGDDVYGDDPTVRRLEEYGAEIIAKEASLFVPSGTFGNQLCLFTLCPRGSEVILGEDCHIVQHEVGAASVIAGVQLRTLAAERGLLPLDRVVACIRREEADIHFPGTSALCLENAHSNGRVIPFADMKRLSDAARAKGVSVHLDGARIFNAGLALGVDAARIAACADSVMFCLSKGLCAPVGSLIAGRADFIAKARKKRKLMGGGMRQAGFLAAAGLVALRTMRERLREDHENARELASLLAGISGVRVDPESVQINMVFFEVENKVDADAFVRRFLEAGIRINPPDSGVLRFVTNYWVKRGDLALIAETTEKAIRESTAAG
jgi:threonine aldolase